MSVSHLLQLACIVLLVAIGGCAGPSLQYLGNSNEIGDAPTPAGFTISPSDAMHINSLHRNYRKKTVDDFYHDERSYYVCDGFRWGHGRGSTASEARKYGTVINGQTGEVYNRKTELWEPNPEIERESQTE